MLNLYKNIKKRRLELNLTQTDLSLRLGYRDKSTIAKIESGVVDLSHNKILEFARALETTPEELLGWELTAPDITRSAQEIAKVIDSNHHLLSLFSTIQNATSDEIKKIHYIAQIIRGIDISELVTEEV